MSEEMKDIESIIDQLDKSIPKPTGEVKMDTYGGGADESRIRATRAGFLRLGVELMKAAFAKPVKEDKPNVIDVDLGDLVNDDSVIQFDWFERVEDMTQPERKLNFRDKLIPAVIVTLLLAFLVCAIIGIGTVIWWFST